MIRNRRPRHHHNFFFLTSTRASSKCSPINSGPPPVSKTPSLLDVSVILSPGKFCKTPNATILDASKRLVDGRRKFVQSLQSDLKLSTKLDYKTMNSCSSSRSASNYTNSTKQIYELVGHGVPTGLLHQLCNAAKGWLGIQQHTKTTLHINNDDDDAQQQQQQQQYDQINFTNISNTTLLDTKRIYCTMSSNPQRSSNDDTNDDTNDDDDPTKSSSVTLTSKEVLPLSSLPMEWDYNIEIYMVVMDRIASRMASIAIMALPHPIPHSHHRSSSSSSSSNKESVWKDESRESTTDNSIIITPSRLQQYNVTISRASATASPNNNSITSLLSDKNHISSLNTTTPTKTTAIARKRVWNDSQKNQRRQSLDYNSDDDDVDVHLPPPTLTLEYVRKSSAQTMSDDEDDDDCCWKVILKLQDHHPTGKSIHRDTNTSVSLVFEGEYALTP